MKIKPTTLILIYIAPFCDKCGKQYDIKSYGMSQRATKACNCDCPEYDHQVTKPGTAKIKYFTNAEDARQWCMDRGVSEQDFNAFMAENYPNIQCANIS